MEPASMLSSWPSASSRFNMSRLRPAKFTARCPSAPILMPFLAVVSSWKPGAVHTLRPALTRFGHDMRLVAAQFGRLFVKSNKVDPADAEGISKEAQRSECVSWPRRRKIGRRCWHYIAYANNCFGFATCRSTGFKGCSTIFGAVLPQGRWASTENVKVALAFMADEPPASLSGSLQDHISRFRALDEQIARADQRVIEWRRNDDACKRVSAIPDVCVGLFLDGSRPRSAA